MTTRRAMAAVLLIAGVLTAAMLLHCDGPPATQPQTPAGPTAAPPVASQPAAAPVAASQPVEPPGRGQLLHQSTGRTRTDYLLYLPEGYRADRQWPVLLVLAGQEQSPRQQATGWLAEADRHGWVVVAPSLVSPGKAARAGNDWVIEPKHLQADVQAVEAVMAELFGRWSLKRSGGMIAATGLATPAAVESAVARPARWARVALLNPQAPLEGVGPQRGGRLGTIEVLVLRSEDRPLIAATAFQAAGYFSRLGAKVRSETVKRADQVHAAAAEFFAPAGRGQADPPAERGGV